MEFGYVDVELCGASENEVEKLFCFPRREERSKRWQLELGMVCQGVFSSSVRICNRHFAVNCFIPKTTSLRLRPDAVPTLFTIRQNSFAASSAIENTDQVPLPDKKIVPAVVQDISLLPSVHYKHFEKSQFENKRSDGKVKLRPNAVPTLFDVPNSSPVIDLPDTKCALQIMMEYHELEGYLRIKSEEPDIKEEENGCEGNENNSHSLINSSMILSDNTDIKPVVDKSFNPETNQTTIKSDPFQDAESVQCQQKSVMEYDELEGCWNIKSEEFHIKEEEDECEGVMTYDDTDIKPFVDKSHNDETNQMTIECVPHQKWSTPRIDHKVIEDREVTPYPCKLCSYEAKLKEDLTQHMLIHQDISKVTPYQCKLCPYKTKRKGVLSKRGRNHENASEVITYQCKLCPYKTKSKGVLSKHVRILHNTSEVATYQCKVYQCKLCSYKTNQKGSLTRHDLVHQNASEVTFYGCNLCLYKTKRKDSLNKHVLIHQDISKVTTYQCHHCSYKTKWKTHLSKHVQVHQNISNVCMTQYQCKLCPYKTTQERYLTRHDRIHQDPSELKSYQCKLCPYKTRWKECLSRHAVIHQNASEIMTYRCNHCPYGTKWKTHLVRHIQIHQGAPYECKFCPYKTKRKRALPKHVRYHHK